MFKNTSTVFVLSYLAFNTFFVNLMHIQYTNIPVTPVPDQRICWDRAFYEATATIPTFEDFIASVGHGYGLYQGLIPAETLTQIGGATYQAEVGESIALSLLLYSNDPQKTYRIFFIINGEPYPHEVNGQMVYYRDVTLSPEMNAPISVDLTTPTLNAGLHDIVAVVMSSDDVPDLYQPSVARGSRISIIVGEGWMQTFPHQSPAEYTIISTNDAAILAELGVTRRNATTYWLGTEQFLYDQPLSFDITRGYRSHNINVDALELPAPSTDRFALLVFVNGEPMPLDNDFTLYAEMPRDTIAARFPVQIDTVLAPGTYELVVVAIPHPNIPVCMLFGPSDGYLFLFTPEFTRLTFEVIE